MFLICLVGCSGESDEPKTVVSISIDESTIPERILVSKLEEELAKIKVEVTFSDNTTQIISLSKSMFFPNDVDKLMSGGKYKLKVTYEYITTDIILHTFLVFPVIYSINVVKPDGDRQYEKFKELHFRQPCPDARKKEQARAAHRM